jgi:hypothetical protein
MYKYAFAHFIFNDDSPLIQLHTLTAVEYLHFWLMLAATYKPECNRRNMNYCSSPSLSLQILSYVDSRFVAKPYAELLLFGPLKID